LVSFFPTLLDSHPSYFDVLPPHDA
jgi:hypothetical protein